MALWLGYTPIIGKMLAMIAAASPGGVARAAVPFPMDRVTLTGDWKHAQDANQEVGASRCAFHTNPLPPRPCPALRC